VSLKKHQLRKRVNKRFQAAYDNYGYLSLCSIVNSNLMLNRKQKNSILPRKVYIFNKQEENKINIDLLPQQVNIAYYNKKDKF
jgi:hypothetical protein